MPDIVEWNRGLTELNADLGKKKEVNIIVAVVANADKKVLYGFEEAWVGGKKNDFVVIICVSSYPAIDWVQVMSWTRAEELKVNIRDRIQDIGCLCRRDEILATIGSLVDEKFVRRPWEDFKYLVAGAKPPTWALVLIWILGVGVSTWQTIYFYKEDPFGDREDWRY